MVKFGPGGNCDWFYESGYKNTYQVPEFLGKVGLDAYEIQCGRGVRMREDAAVKLKKSAEENNIILSVHAPYYISMSSTDEQKRLNSINYILQSASLARLSGANRIVIHSGSCSKMSREHALELAVDTMKQAVAAMDENGFGDICMCPETMGKINQLGTLNEVLELCSVDERIIPTVDFGHINAREQGCLYKPDDFERIIDKIQNRLGEFRAKNFHVHFSKIEYSAGGEKRHLTFEDTEYGPEFEPFAEIILKRDLSPIIICESAGTMSKDALFMKNTLKNLEKSL
ncbi:MAG: TIM barrel protein [Clostridia bacterium]|nr:TIM barrel protein [Clostridia bacterium]